MITDSLVVDRAEFETQTGWQLKPEGACRGDQCIPLDPTPTGPTVDLTVVAEQMGLPLVHEETHGVWALGPASVGSRALSTVDAPNLVLPDVHGNDFELHSLRGTKVVLVAWSPY